MLLRECSAPKASLSKDAQSAFVSGCLDPRRSMQPATGDGQGFWGIHAIATVQIIRIDK